MNKQLRLGQMIHYVIDGTALTYMSPDMRPSGCRAAVVTKVRGDGAYNVTIFSDGNGDGLAQLGGAAGWRKGVVVDATDFKLGTLHTEDVCTLEKRS